jgi:hypothetical protein
MRIRFFFCLLGAAELDKKSSGGMERSPSELRSFFRGVIASASELIKQKINSKI